MIKVSIALVRIPQCLEEQAPKWPEGPWRYSMGGSHSISAPGARTRQDGRPSLQIIHPRTSQNIYYLYTHPREMHETSTESLETDIRKETLLSSNSCVY